MCCRYGPPRSTRLRLRPVKGYEEEYRAAADMLHEDLGLCAARSHLLLDALAGAGRVPGETPAQNPGL